MFRFAVDRDIIEFDPTASLSVTKTTTKPTERDRILNELEIRALARQLPEANSKNGKTHIIYLSDFALKQFKLLKLIAKSETWIFANRDNSSHVREKSISIQIRGRQTTTILSNRSKDSEALILTGGKWTPHDFGVQVQP
jgi:integrase